MIKIKSQKELISLLESNELNVKCFLEEVGKSAPDDYIYIRRLNDKKIWADNKAGFCINCIELTVYSKTVKNRTELCKFVESNFNVSFSFARNGDVFTAMAILSLIVGDWNG